MPACSAWHEFARRSDCSIAACIRGFQLPQASTKSGTTKPAGRRFFVGLDAHKDSTSVAACEASREPARFVGTIGPDVRALLKLLAKAGDPAQVSVVYEAGPTGYGLYRELCRRGYRCEIVAPSLIPRRAGDRVKNDRRDCARLAELSRAGELKPSPTRRLPQLHRFIESAQRRAACGDAARITSPAAVSPAPGTRRFWPSTPLWAT